MAEGGPRTGRGDGTGGAGVFLHLRRSGEGVRAEGAAHHATGHRLPRPDGSCDGVFAEWNWDGSRLTVSNCRYGLYPLFYFVRPGEICISTSIDTLLQRGASPELDVEAVAILLRLNWLLGEDTPFKEIRAVPPAARFTWDGELHLDGGLRHVRPSGLTREAAVDAYIACFRRAIERRYADDAIVPLSGGRDSRHILFELCRIGRPKLCVTVKEPPPWPNPNENTQIARQLTARFGIEHIVLDYPGDVVEAERRKNALTHFSALEHTWYLPVHDCLKGRQERIFDGLGGDFLSAGGGIDKEGYRAWRSGRTDDLVRYILTRRHVPGLPFLKDPEQFPFEAACARLAREVVRHLDAPNPIGSFLFWNRVRRGIGLMPCGIMAGHDVVTPYVDHDVFDLLTGLPTEMYLDKAFHTDAILRAFPEHADIPFEAKTRTPASSPRAYAGRNWLRVLYAAATEGRECMRLSYLAPRLLFYALRGEVRPVWYDNAAIYVMQLKELASSRAAVAA